MYEQEKKPILWPIMREGITLGELIDRLSILKNRRHLKIKDIKWEDFRFDGEDPQKRIVILFYD